MKNVVLIIGILFLFSCSTEVIKSRKNKGENVTIKTGHKKKSKIVTALHSDDLEIMSTKKYSNGLVISWLKHGKGEKIKKGDVINIDYKVTLEDGKIIDGNHFRKMEFFSFVVGFQMQTPGWDFALENMKVGDFARVKIPAELARGEKGIRKEGEKDWFVPPNSVNYLSIRILSKQKPTREIDGTKVWVYEENKANKIKFNESNSVIFHYMISSESKPNYSNSYSTNTPYRLLITDKGIIPGLKKALINAKKADRMFVIVPASEAYGSKGLEGAVKPDEDLFYSLLIMDVVPK